MQTFSTIKSFIFSFFLWLFYIFSWFFLGLFSPCTLVHLLLLLFQERVLVSHAQAQAQVHAHRGLFAEGPFALCLHNSSRSRSRSRSSSPGPAPVSCKKGNKRRAVSFLPLDDPGSRGHGALVSEANCVQNKSTRVVNRSWDRSILSISFSPGKLLLCCWCCCCCSCSTLLALIWVAIEERLLSPRLSALALINIYPRLSRSLAYVVSFCPYRCLRVKCPPTILLSFFAFFFFVIFFFLALGLFLLLFFFTHLGELSSRLVSHFVVSASFSWPLCCTADLVMGNFSLCSSHCKVDFVLMANNCRQIGFPNWVSL